MKTKDEIVKLNLCDENCLFNTDCISCLEIKYQRLVQESEANNGSN